MPFATALLANAVGAPVYGSPRGFVNALPGSGSFKESPITVLFLTPPVR
jgi:hypothetical protein